MKKRRSFLIKCLGMVLFPWNYLLAKNPDRVTSVMSFSYCKDGKWKRVGPKVPVEVDWKRLECVSEVVKDNS